MFDGGTAVSYSSLGPFGDADRRKTDHLVKMANKVLRGIKCGQVRRFRTQISKGWVYGSGVKSYQLFF